VIRDSAAALRNIASIRLDWQLGRYRSALLGRVPLDDWHEDMEAAQAIGAGP
jgi:hypothetical protein